MNASLPAVLTDAERLMVAETEPAELAPLSEDEAVELHGRIRSARNKYAGQYRRSGSARVAQKGGRGKARLENSRAAMKAEAFEIALARVSSRVAVLARQSAARLRADRIAAAKAAKTASPRPAFARLGQGASQHSLHRRPPAGKTRRPLTGQLRFSAADGRHYRQVRPAAGSETLRCSWTLARCRRIASTASPESRDRSASTIAQ